MFVKLSADGSVTLEDRDNFRAFKLVIEGGPARLDQARRALANTAELPDQAHRLDLRAGAAAAARGRADDAAWQSNLGAMIEKAKPHGWIDEQKKAIKAHIEWTETGMSLEFGIFDHLDRNDLPLRDYYEERLKVIEAFDRGGFYAYHVAEHHFTPLGMAPSPSVFLSAIAQRTQAAALRHLRLCAAAASSAAGAGRNLHARPSERRTGRDRLRPRLGALRDFLLRPECRRAASRSTPSGWS